MSNRLLKLLPILLAFVLICSVSVFAVFADESEAESTADESVTETSDESATETSDEASETSGEESETSGEEEESDKEEESDGKEENKTSEAPKTESSTAGHDHDHDHDHEEETSGGLSARNWQLIITAAVVVILIAVLFILAKTNTKVGQKIANFFKNNKSEIKKIVWMPKNDLVKSTGIVLLVLVVACALIGLLDFAFSSVLNLLSSIG